MKALLPQRVLPRKLSACECCSIAGVTSNHHVDTPVKSFRGHVCIYIYTHTYIYVYIKSSLFVPYTYTHSQSHNKTASPHAGDKSLSQPWHATGSTFHMAISALSRLWTVSFQVLRSEAGYVSESVVAKK